MYISGLDPIIGSNLGHYLIIMDSWIILLELIANKNLGARMYYTDIGTLSKDRNRLLEIFYMSIDYEEIRSYDCLYLE